MANEENFTNNSHSKSFPQVVQVVESANEETSLDSTSADSESAASFHTEIELKSSTQPNTSEEKVHFKDASNVKKLNNDDEGIGDQSVSSTSITMMTSKTNTTSTTTANNSEIQTDRATEQSRLNDEETDEKLDVGESSSVARQGTSKSFYGQQEDEECGGSDEDEKDYDERSFEDEDTISSEAVVDDIELILMPETVQDIPNSDLSPQLVRVTELKRAVDYDGDVFRDNDDDEETDQESDFKKMGSEDDEDDDDEMEKEYRKSHKLVLLSAGEDNEELSDSKDSVNRKGRKSSGKVNSGVQTDITALESSDTTTSIPFEFMRKSSGKSSGGRLLGIPSSSGGKRLNWKSELTLLPSKTKISTAGFSGYESMNYQDQYSPRVAKFTSQDTLNSSSQFLKPSTLYRTRNLSRNLNQCASSESTLAMPVVGVANSTDSTRYRDRVSSSTSSNFREMVALQSYAAYHINAAASSARHQPPTSYQIRNFRSSLPDLSTSSKGSDNKGLRQSFRSIKHHKSSSGYRLQKKSSSDDETSSLIDESERCLRSSIDLLLTDDLPSPAADLSCRSSGFFGIATTASYGYYSSRRSHSQPLLTDDGDCGDLRDGTMGSPFLPRKLRDMRCSRWAKVILPGGQVAVVAVKEMDELRDNLTVHTDTGCILSLPFRKVVFAWKTKV